MCINYDFQKILCPHKNQPGGFLQVNLNLSCIWTVLQGIRPYSPKKMINGPAWHGIAHARHDPTGHGPVWPACHRAMPP